MLMLKYLALALVMLALAPTATRASATDFDLKDFGAVGDGQTDDGPALQSALDALAQAGGGTLFVPQGRYALITPVYKDFSGLATSVTIIGVESSTPVDNTGQGEVLAHGLDLVSEFVPMTGESGIALSVSGLQHFLIKDIAFAGTPDVVTDASIVLALKQIEDATIRHCEFYGLISNSQGGAIVLANRSGLRIELSKFLGCTGNSAGNVPVVQNLSWKSISVTDSTFLDYGLRPGFLGKTGIGTPLSWINIGNADAISSDSPRREAVFNNVFLDEVSLAGILVIPHLYEPASALIDLVYITGLRMNVSSLDYWGNYFLYPRAVFIEKSRYEYSQHANAAISLNAVGTAILDGVECLDSANRIYADPATQRLSVINSVYSHLDSEAQTTDVINTDSSADDPVQYVRGQFEAILNRVPDPAAHFYWSDRILRCGDDPDCAASTRSEFDSYLGSTPEPRFSISGHVTDADGNALVDHTVSLSGAQTVEAQTDADGFYRFSGLPTSGVYTVSTSKDHFTFNQPNVGITTPSGDQTVDFMAVLNKYSIAGQIVYANGNAVADIPVALSGAMSGNVTTDDNGNFVFEDLPALESYTVTPTHKDHTFEPAFWTITKLIGDHSGDIIATRNTHAIQGRIATSDGLPISGVPVNLTGSDTGVTTTNSGGNYAFASVPAGGDYVITVSKTNYLFTPVSKTVNDLSASEAVDFTGALVNYGLNGRITSGGTSLGGVTVTLSGSKQATVTTDEGGNYSFTATAEGNYTITPSRTHYSFNPANVSSNNLSANQTVTFSATLNQHAISGRVTKADGTALAGATLSLSGSQTSTVTSNANGDYSFAGLPAGGAYVVAVSKVNYSFNPRNSSWSDLGTNSTANFTGQLVSYQISGRVTLNGVALAGVTLTVSGSQNTTATSGADGSYLVMVPAEGNYTVTPSSTKYTFSPASAVINNLSGNSVGDFAATLKPGVPVLISEENSTRALAFDSVMQTREPFQLTYPYPWTSDRRTRVMLFAMNFELAANESAAAVTADGEDAAHRIYPLTVEYVGKVSGWNWLNCIVVRLDDNLGDVGDVLVRITYRNVSSNRLRLGIGHIGGGLPDDAGSVATPGRAPY